MGDRTTARRSELEARDASVEGRCVAVIGAGGFIGSAVVRGLVSRGAVVRALLGPPGAPFAAPPSGVASSFADLGDVRALHRWVVDAEIVVNTAGPPSVAASFDDPGEFARVHVAGTANIMQACRSTAVGRIVHVSSAELYSPSADPVAEDHAVDPRSPYGIAKLGAEGMVRVLAPICGMEAVILRPFSIYGPGSPKRSLIGSVARQAIRAEGVTVADLAPVRDYCFVDDIADAVIGACCRRLSGPTPTFNVASGRGISVGEVARMLVELSGRDIPIVVAAGSDRPTSSAVSILVADTNRARRELGWEPTTRLGDGLMRTLAWVRSLDAAHD